MNAIKNFIVKFDTEFKGKIEKDGLIIFLSSIYRDRKNLTKYGKVVSNPIDCPGFTVKEGEYVWFHHNVASTTVQTGPSGNKRVDSQYMIDKLDKLYSIPPELIYAYTEDGKVKCTSEYCFVSPIKQPYGFNGLKSDVLWLPGDDLSIGENKALPTSRKNMLNIGLLRCGNTEMEEKGYHEGDIVFYESDSEYEINVHNELMWRMRQSYIHGKFRSSEVKG